ncbi:MAG: hypothetical protein WCA49_20860 [Candidatus Sulfotelmatobacter sp.]
MDCLFCSIQEISNPSNPEDEILDESENFYAKAALGHFVFGYTLIISKEHLPSFAYVPEHLFPELEGFRNNVLDKLHNLCQHLWLLKNSISQNWSKKLCARKPCKRVSWFS